jgi:hypothetical protein
MHDAIAGLLECLKANIDDTWPGLHTLALVHDTGYPSLRLDLHQMVSARITSGHPINKLRLSPSIISTLAEDLEPLRELVEIEVSTVYREASQRLGMPFVVDWPEDDD